MRKGTIAGIVVGVFFGGFVIAVVLMIYIVRHRRDRGFKWRNPPFASSREVGVGDTTLNSYPEAPSAKLGKELISQPGNT